MNSEQHDAGAEPFQLPLTEAQKQEIDRRKKLVHEQPPMTTHEIIAQMRRLAIASQRLERRVQREAAKYLAPKGWVDDGTWLP